MRTEKIVETAAEFILTRDIAELANLTAEEVALNIGVDSLNLSRYFKKAQKMTIANFILREKLYRAYFILSADSVKPIDALSSELGFPGVEDFTVKFEKFFAIKPKKYKDINKNPPEFK